MPEMMLGMNVRVETVVSQSLNKAKMATTYCGLRR